MLIKLFLLRFNCSNDDMQPRSPGIEPSMRLQSLKSSSFKDHKPDNGGSTKLRGFGLLLGFNKEEKYEAQGLHTVSLHPKESTWSFFNSTMEDGGCLIAVPSA